MRTNLGIKSCIISKKRIFNINVIKKLGNFFINITKKLGNKTIPLTILLICFLFFLLGLFIKLTA